MVFLDTPEMVELKRIFEKYMDKNYNFVPDTPFEAEEAYEKYLDLMEKQHDDEVKSWFE